LVVLAHLQRWWSLSSREGFGVHLVVLARSGVFEEMKCLFSIVSEARKGGESPECLSLKNFNRTRSREDLRVRSVAAVAEARGLGFCTGASDHSRDRRVRSGAQRVCSSRGRSDAVARPVASGPLLDSNRTPGAARPVKRCSEFGHDNVSL
jgi:hypothetical protein